MDCSNQAPVFLNRVTQSRRVALTENICRQRSWQSGASAPARARAGSATRVAGVTNLSILAILQNPTAADLASVELPGFEFAGFDLLDVCGDVSALTNCGGFDEVFQKAEISDLGLLRDLSRAYEVQVGLAVRYPQEPHARCHVWAIWRLADPAQAVP